MDTPVMKVTAINHVVLHVSDLDASLRFYQGVLGFEIRGTNAGPERRMRFLRCGLQGLDLFEVSSDVHGGEEMNHMAVNCDADDVDEVVAALEAVGIDASDRTNRNSVFILDPDGHRIEMLPRNSMERERERAAASASTS